MIFPLITFGIVAFALCYVGVALFRYWANERELLALPNERSSHTVPTPTGGGVAIVVVTITGWIIYSLIISQLKPLLFFTIGAILIAAVSWIDDLKTLPTLFRFGIHGLCAAIAVLGFGYFETIHLPIFHEIYLGNWGLPLTILWIVGLTNSFNFMDGIDGIAGTQALTAGVGWLLIGWLGNQNLVMMIGLLLAATSLGFLFHNWQPAKIFMGDVSSAFLGYTFAVLPLLFVYLAPEQNKSISCGVLLLWVFIFDTMFTFIRRALHGENVFAAHRSHLYQRLVIMGFSHSRVTIAYGLLAIVGIFLSLAWFNTWSGYRVYICLLPLMCFGLWLFVAVNERATKADMIINGSKLETKMMNEFQKNQTQPVWMRFLTKQTQFFLDLFVLIAAFFLAYSIRFEFSFQSFWVDVAIMQFPWVVLLQLAALIFTGVYSFVWKYVGLSELKAFVRACGFSLLPLVLLRFTIPDRYITLKLPISVIIVDAMLAFGGVAGLRVLRRMMYERYEQKSKLANAIAETPKRTLFIGAGRAGVMAVREIIGRGSAGMDIMGFVDDDSGKQGSRINGVKVLGTTEDLPKLVRRYDIDQVVITIAQATRKEMQRIVDICERLPVKMRIIPGYYEIIEGKVEVNRIRDVQIEDLLGREPVQLDDDLMKRLYKDKIIMVTGAGGSIGSELARQAARFNPKQILLVERAEFALFNIDREMRETFPELSIVPLTADVCDRKRMEAVFNEYHPDVILHAAAHKHVPMMEINPTEAIKNNVLGTHCLGELAGKSDVEVFVMISTDKAVRPSSIMGASKRVAELVIQNLDRQFKTKYVAVRFGNVIGSAGSVIPIFREQILKGGPVTVTHKDMVRYFMTIPEAAQLVLQAGAMGEGGEIFILDMGEPVRILDLAEDTIALSGLKPYEDIEIVFTGIRPGEKLFEELQTNEEVVTKTRHPKIFIGKITKYPTAKVQDALETLKQWAHDNGSAVDLKTYLSELLPESQLEIPQTTNITIQTETKATTELLASSSHS
jgi:FlaA1/EpsC-like NDP-sugar epimerase/UDP-N-acetylmuramyl pentapeptide phosphotransferase/UDP-N-acetylglucosamine-1-phosphate transferase